MKTKAIFTNCIHSSLGRALLCASLLIGCYAISPLAQAVSPALDGCYPKFTTAEGCNALSFLTTGVGNTALGWESLLSDTTGSYNTAVGAGALILNNGDSNTAVGAVALLLNTTGTQNTAVGTDAMVYNDSGYQNTATGAFALFSNTIGNRNNAFGFNALLNHTSGDANNAVGYGALSGDQSGGSNNAFGYIALESNVNGSSNTAVGDLALLHSSGSSNTALGAGAGMLLEMGDGNIYIGAAMGGAPDESNHTYIGNIGSTTVSGGGTDTVTVDLTTGLLGHLSSSRRYKQDIKPMDNASGALYQLNPVTFRYRKEIDRTQSLAFGFVAEEVAQVNPDLVARNSKGQPESVHYEMVNAMLLNEFLKEHRKVQKLEAALDAVNKRLKKQDAKIAELQMSKLPVRIVSNNQ